MSQTAAQCDRAVCDQLSLAFCLGCSEMAGSEEELPLAIANNGVMEAADPGEHAEHQEPTSTLMPLG